ncbi:MAG: group III truncated hemoglobin [Sulfitobacter sp.]
MSLAVIPNLTHAEIRTVVSRFYARVREHPDLGPIFGQHVSAWPAHEEKIALFWFGALLREKGYSANPMQKHIAAKNVKPDHFPIWLGIFDEVLTSSLPPAKADHWSLIAHRIGQSLSFGLTQATRKAENAPPILTR